MKYYDLYINNNWIGQYHNKKDAKDDMDDYIQYITENEFNPDNPDTATIEKCDDLDYVTTVIDKKRVSTNKWININNKEKENDNH